MDEIQNSMADSIGWSGQEMGLHQLREAAEEEEV